MREFIDIITESSRPQVLYHGTSVVAAASIIEEQVIRAGDDDDGPYGVSLTLKAGVAEGFAHDVDYRGVENAKVDGIDYAALVGRPWSCRGCVLAFNAKTLREAVTLVRHCWDGCDSEHEMRAKGEGFSIVRHLLRFKVSEADLDWWIAAYQAEAGFWAQHGDEREAGFASQRAQMVEALRNHPLRRK